MAAFTAKDPDDRTAFDVHMRKITDQPGDDEVLVEAPDAVPGLLFVRVPEPRSAKNRVHLDWKPDGRSRDEEVERAVSLGATMHEDHRGPEDRGWATLRDPEGNEFCIERQ